MADSKTKKVLEFAGDVLQGFLGGAAWDMAMSIIKSGADKIGGEISNMDVKKFRIAISGNLELDDENLYATALARVKKINYALVTEAEAKLSDLSSYKANMARLVMLGEPYVGDIDNQEAKKVHKESRILNCMEQIEMIATFDEDEWNNHKKVMAYNDKVLDEKWGGLIGKLRSADNKVAESGAVKALDAATADNWTAILENFGLAK